MQVDSRLRVLLRVERNRLAKLLASVGLLATDASDIFQQVDLGIMALSKRLTVAQRLDELRNQFDLRSSSCPPSVSDNIDQHLQEAADQLRSLFLTGKNVDNANAALDKAEDLLNTLDKADALAKDIAAKHTQLMARVATFNGADFAAMKEALPGLFLVLSQTYDDAHPVLPSNFMQVDDSIARVNVSLDYTYVRATTKDKIIQERFDKRTHDLIALMGTRDWRSLRSARGLVQQMRQNIYIDDLMEELKNKKARINVDQQVARPYLPLEFCICFQRYDYNHAQALEELTCDWKFDDKLTEKGWAVCHFFQEAGEKTITAEVPFPTDGGPAQADTQPASRTEGTTCVEFTKQLPVRETSDSFSKPKWFAEGLRFAIAFFLALVGLVAGAQDQLAKLDVLPALIAVFLLGFGADAIKNILAQPAQTPQSPAKP